MINFEKRREMAELIFELQGLQQQTYSAEFKDEPSIRAYLTHFTPLSSRRIAELAQQATTHGPLRPFLPHLSDKGHTFTNHRIVETLLLLLL